MGNTLHLIWFLTVLETSTAPRPGGIYGLGNVFELVHNENGKWIFKELYEFQGGKDGAGPYGGMVMDSAGNLYGTTDSGGGGSRCGQYGCGTVFELVHSADGNWEEKILHRFNQVDGNDAQTDLVMDKAGNLYGATYFGGWGNTCQNQGTLDTSCGVVFEVVPDGGGSWTEKVLHSFNYNNGKDGSNPFMNSLAFDADGNLYGTTGVGGAGECVDDDDNLVGCGTIFELRKNSQGHWIETILHSFEASGQAGNFPIGLIWDSEGFFYGSTASGGAGDGGTILEFTRNGGGTWREEVLFSFGGSNGDGPGQLTMDKSGNLYGTTFGGGSDPNCDFGYGCGTVFGLFAGKDGKWTGKTIFSFDGKTGQGPNETLVWGPDGAHYGTTLEGGNMTDCYDQSGCGVVFEVEP